MKIRLFASIAILGTVLAASCQNQRHTDTTQTRKDTLMTHTDPNKLDTAVLAGGCFWCLDAVYRRMKGVENVISGYANGQVKNPTYKDVCTGTTGHAEAVEIIFDTSQTSYAEILEVFWRIHNPTTLNRQGNDIGTQYRSGIYFRNTEQAEIARKSYDAAQESKIWEGKFVTELEPLRCFYEAEAYHQDYYTNNSDQGYCVYVVGEKVNKFKKLFHDKLKEK